MPPEPIILDLDPGGLVWTGLDVDDDLALLIAVALNRTGELSLRGLTICGGNAPLKHTAEVTQLLRRHAGLDALPFALGAGWRDMQVAWPSMRRLSWPCYPNILP